MTLSNVAARPTSPPLSENMSTHDCADCAVTLERVEEASLEYGETIYFPPFLNVKQAAEYSGMSTTEIDKALHAIFPLPHFKVGKNYKIVRDKIVPWFLKNRSIIGKTELEGL